MNKCWKSRALRHWPITDKLLLLASTLLESNIKRVIFSKDSISAGYSLQLRLFFSFLGTSLLREYYRNKVLFVPMVKILLLLYQLCSATMVIFLTQSSSERDRIVSVTLMLTDHKFCCACVCARVHVCAVIVGWVLQRWHVFDRIRLCVSFSLNWGNRMCCRNYD